MVKEDPIYAPDIDALSNGGEGSEPMSNGGGIRLFKNSTPGIVLDHIGKAYDCDKVFLGFCTIIGKACNFKNLVTDNVSMRR